MNIKTIRSCGVTVKSDFGLYSDSGENKTLSLLSIYGSPQQTKAVFSALAESKAIKVLPDLFELTRPSSLRGRGRSIGRGRHHMLIWSEEGLADGIVWFDEKQKEETRAGSLYIRLEYIQAAKRTAAARLSVHRLTKAGFTVKTPLTVKPGDSLKEKTGLVEYEGFEVEEINPWLKTVSFANGTVLKPKEEYSWKKVLLGSLDAAEEEALIRWLERKKTPYEREYLPSLRERLIRDDNIIVFGGWGGFHGYEIAIDDDRLCDIMLEISRGQRVGYIDNIKIGGFDSREETHERHCCTT